MRQVIPVVHPFQELSHKRRRVYYKSYGFFARPGEIHGGESIKSQYLRTNIICSRQLLIKQNVTL